MAIAAVALAIGIYGGFAISSSSSNPTEGSPSLRSAETQSSERLAGTVKAPGDAGTYWGIFADGAPSSTARLESAENTVGQTPAIVMWYEAWDGDAPFPTEVAEHLRSAGIVPMITWEPWQAPVGDALKIVDQPTYRLAKIADGTFDPYVRAYADQVRDFGGPVMLRPFHEMDGFWYPWGGTVNGNTPKRFVAAWRHLHRIFDEEGATNVTWVWSVNAESEPNTAANAPARYWPGPRYVDWIGISGFNWGTSTSFGTWQTFGGIYRKRVAELGRYRKPIILSEVAAPEVGGDKAAWIKTTLATITNRYPTIGAFVWYDRRDSALQDWRITSSESAADAFRRAIASPGVLSAPAAAESTTKHSATSTG